ncbi:MAG: hypothetical protein ACAI38_14095 [Myxococcota bacterium]
MSTNAAQQIEGTRLSQAAGTVPGAGQLPGRGALSSALASPITPAERGAARVQLAQADVRQAPSAPRPGSRLGPQQDRNTRDFSGAISIGPNGVSGGVVVTPPGYPVYPAPVYPPVIVGPPVVVAPPVVIGPPIYGPPVYGPPVVVGPPVYHRPWYSPWRRDPIRGYRPCSAFEAFFTSGAVNRHGRHYCPIR